jgi:CRISPR-associated protein Cmr2
MTEDRRDFWKAKLSALVHDPLGKVLDIKGHEALAKKIAEMLDIEYNRGQEDKIASSMDRFFLPYEKHSQKAGKQIRIEPEEIEIIHPFSGEKFESDITERLRSVNTNYVDAFSNLIELNKGVNGIDHEKMYHALWWNLPYLMDMTQFMPADSRIPNHSIVDHLDTTAALRPCIKGQNLEATLIAMAISPVQEVIAQARKTRDLWAGSYLLSYLIYRAIERVGLKYGFDAIIYPYLRGIPFVRDILENIKGVKFVDFYILPSMSDKVASLPNIFVAVVPTENAESVIKECKEALTGSWKNLCDEACKKITLGKGQPSRARSNAQATLQYVTDFDQDVFLCQASLFPNVSVVACPLLDPENAVDEVKKLFVGSKAEDYQKALDDISNHGGYKPNKGAYYRYSYRILMSKLAAVKHMRCFKPFEDRSCLSVVGQADDFGGDVKGCAIFVEKDEEDNEKRDVLGALNSVKRVLATVLRKTISYESTLDIALKNKSEKNGYIAVLLMDGDRMGKWVSGDSAPDLGTFVHAKVKDAFLASGDLSEAWSVLSKLKPLQPSYHRGLSRILSVFSSLVEAIVTMHDGMLVYCGGDDVLALLPADQVLECANKIRKLYSGNDAIEICCGDKAFHTGRGVLWTEDRPIAPLMGSKATMSAGISVIHYKSPLQFAIKLAREAEKYAKETLGRDAFAFKLMRRSGQMTMVGAKWNYEDLNDTAQVAVDILEGMEKLKISHRSLYKMLCPDLSLFGDDIHTLTDYVISRSIQTQELVNAEELDKLKSNIKSFVRAVFELHKGISNDDGRKPDIEEALRAPIEILLLLRLIKRGDER